MNTDQAKSLMEGFCKVCPVCNGKACAGEVPGMGGTGSGTSFVANIEALSAVRLKMRVLHCTSLPTTATELLGMKLSMPIMAAPIGGVSFNMSKKMSEEDYVEAIINGCCAEGTVGCTGDGVPSYIHQTAFEAIKKASGHGIPFIKPWDDQMFFDKIDAAQKAGTQVIGIDIDAIGLGTVNLMGASIPLRGPAEMEKLLAKIPLKVILKGIMDAEEAETAVAIGADAIVVSNHGGRVLDGTKGTAEVLPDIAARIKGRVPILVDGGIRSGSDVLKMLALGADAVLIGRPLGISVFCDQENGVREYLQGIHKQLVQSMLLTGCKDIKSINKSVIDF